MNTMAAHQAIAQRIDLFCSAAEKIAVDTQSCAASIREQLVPGLHALNPAAEARK